MADLQNPAPEVRPGQETTEASNETQITIPQVLERDFHGIDRDSNNSIDPFEVLDAYENNSRYILEQYQQGNTDTQQYRRALERHKALTALRDSKSYEKLGQQDQKDNDTLGISPSDVKNARQNKMIIPPMTTGDLPLIHATPNDSPQTILDNFLQIDSSNDGSITLSEISSSFQSIERHYVDEIVENGEPSEKTETLYNALKEARNHLQKKFGSSLEAEDLRKLIRERDSQNNNN